MDRSQLKAVSSKGGSAPHSSKRGFAAMDTERLREVSKKGITARRVADLPAAAPVPSKA